MRRAIAIMMLLAGPASAQNVTYLTNNVLALSASSSPLVWYVEYSARLTVLARRGSSPVDLTGTRVELALSDRRDGLTVSTTQGSILDATNGYATATMNVATFEPGPYLLTMAAIDEETGATVTDLSLNNLTLTNWCDGCGSSGGATIASGAVQVAVQAGVTGNTFQVTAGDVIASGGVTINVTNLFPGVSAITPAMIDTNVNGVWTINLTTNYPVSIYHQTGNITSVVFQVASTNDVTLGEVLLYATTNAITWPSTSALVWTSVVAPTPTAGQYNRLYFEGWRAKYFGVYVGANP